jgi:hypothetical protein
MALITSAASGNFSAGATWTGGVVPGVGDEARASTGHTITVDVNTTCDEISNAGTGKFVFANGVTLTANVTPKTVTNNVIFLELTSTDSASIVGIITAGTALGAAVAVQGSGTLSITGDTIGSTSANAGRNCVLNNSTGTINITGNSFGGGTGAQSTIANAATGVVNFTGNASGGTGNGAPLQNNSTGTFTVVGNLVASNGAPAFSSASVSATNVLRGNFTASAQGVMPIYAQKVILGTSPTQNTFTFSVDGISDTAIFYTADALPGLPDEADVKDGITYGPSSELTGTFEQTVSPSASDIRDAVWGAATTSLTTAGSIGERLKNCASVDSTGTALATALTAPAP